MLKVVQTYQLSKSITFFLCLFILFLFFSLFLLNKVKCRFRPILPRLCNNKISFLNDCDKNIDRLRWSL